MSAFQSPALRRLLLVPVVLLVSGLTARLQAQVAPAVGIRQNTPAVHAFTNARIVTAPGKVIESGTLVIRDGIIERVGAA